MLPQYIFCIYCNQPINDVRRNDVCSSCFVYFMQLKNEDFMKLCNRFGVYKRPYAAPMPIKPMPIKPIPIRPTVPFQHSPHIQPVAYRSDMRPNCRRYTAHNIPNNYIKSLNTVSMKTERIFDKSSALHRLLNQDFLNRSCKELINIFDHINSLSGTKKPQQITLISTSKEKEEEISDLLETYTDADDLFRKVAKAFKSNEEGFDNKEVQNESTILYQKQYVHHQTNMNAWYDQQQKQSSVEKEPSKENTIESNKCNMPAEMIFKKSKKRKLSKSELNQKAKEMYNDLLYSFDKEYKETEAVQEEQSGEEIVGSINSLINELFGEWQLKKKPIAQKKVQRSTCYTPEKLQNRIEYPQVELSKEIIIESNEWITKANCNKQQDEKELEAKENVQSSTSYTLQQTPTTIETPQKERKNEIIIEIENVLITQANNNKLIEEKCTSVRYSPEQTSNSIEHPEEAQPKEAAIESNELITEATMVNEENKLGLTDKQEEQKIELPNLRTWYDQKLSSFQRQLHNPYKENIFERTILKTQQNFNKEQVIEQKSQEMYEENSEINNNKQWENPATKRKLDGVTGNEIESKLLGEENTQQSISIVDKKLKLQ